MNIGTISVSAGEKKSGFLPVCGTEYQLPLTVVCGAKEGKTVLITAGVHNAEYVGIQAAIELAKELDPAALAGTILIVPLVNVSGFQKRTMSLVYEDQKNLNREFPGKEDGSVADRICHTITTELFSKADYYIDLHSGDGYEELTEYVYYVGAVDEAIKACAYSMARCVNVPYIVESQCTTGGAYNYANSIGIPAILLERGCMGSWSREEVERDKEDVRTILSFLGFTNQLVAYAPKKQHVFSQVIYEDAPVHGCWYPCKNVGERVLAGELLGEIRDYFGEVLHACVAKTDGIVLYQTKSLTILEGGPMITYGVIF